MLNYLKKNVKSVKYTLVAVIIASLVVVVKSTVDSLLLSSLSANDRVVAKKPLDIGLAYEEIDVVSEGRVVKAWWVPAEVESGTSILIFHGQGETMDDWLGVVKGYNDEGFNVFLFDYSGYGESSPITSLENWNSDVKSVLHEFNKRVPDADLTFLVGFSLGAGILLDNIEEVEGACGLLLASTFISIRDLAVHWYSVSDVFKYVVPNVLDNANAISLVQSPVLLLHSESDEMIPVSHSDRLHSAASNLDIEYYRHSGEIQNHYSFWDKNSSVLQSVAIDWIKKRQIGCSK